MSDTSTPLTERQIAATIPGAIASGFWVGFLPVAPGTWASAAILPIGWLVGSSLGWTGLIIASLIVFLVGVWAADFVVRRLGAEDPSLVVVDEYAGQLLTLAAVPLNLSAYGIAFLVFRLCDVLKPWPASWADREMSGGLGAMTDDMIAGAYAAATILTLRYLNWL